jgi:small GTP-binding protein
MEEDENYEILIKLVILGDVSVGKSNFLYRFVDGEFNPIHVATVGFDFKSRVWEIPNLKKKVKFQIWDTAGQEKYMSINKNLFQRVQGIILMYDITREDTFNNLSKWMEHIKENANGIPLILIGNKSDLNNERKVNEEDGKAFAKNNKIIFLEASAKIGTNVEESFMKLSELIIENQNYIDNKEKNNKTEYVISKDSTLRIKDKKKKCC